MLGLKLGVFVFALDDYPLFDIVGPTAGLRARLALGGPLQRLPSAAFDAFGYLHELGMGIDPEGEEPACRVPAVEVFGEREVGAPR